MERVVCFISSDMLRIYIIVILCISIDILSKIYSKIKNLLLEDEIHILSRNLHSKFNLAYQSSFNIHDCREIPIIRQKRMS